jgi:hypothetical protein
MGTEFIRNEGNTYFQVGEGIQFDGEKERESTKEKVERSTSMKTKVQSRCG